jgi:D-3-phosphoglycerate dehydrogenase / 2-oxoglutarate reductase
MKKILIVDKMHASIESMLIEAGFIPDYRPKINRQEILEIIDQYEGIIIRSKTDVDRELIDKGVKLEFVGRAGAGIDKVDYPYLISKNVELINAPEGNRDAVGEHAIGVILCILNKIKQADTEVRNGVWDREANRGWELKSRTVGIYGYGFMGACISKKLAGFGCNVIAYDKYKTDFSNNIVTQVDLESFQNETEILSIHVPLTHETNQLFDHNFLSKFKNLKVIINTARGEVLNLKAVVELLRSKSLIGAGLDVLENEKIDKLSQDEQSIFNELKSFPNVILTPHVAGWTYESYERINTVLVKKMLELTLPNRV